MITDATFDLDLGPSVNAMYANAPGRGRIKSKAYKSWVRGQLKALLAQRARPVQAPVSIELFLPDTMRGDASNRIKAVEDLLVKAGIIPNDSKKFVRSVGISFHGAAQMRVRVQTVTQRHD